MSYLQTHLLLDLHPIWWGAHTAAFPFNQHPREEWIWSGEHHLWHLKVTWPWRQHSQFLLWQSWNLSLTIPLRGSACHLPHINPQVTRSDKEGLEKGRISSASSMSHAGRAWSISHGHGHCSEPIPHEGPQQTALTCQGCSSHIHGAGESTAAPTAQPILFNVPSEKGTAWKLCRSSQAQEGLAGGFVNEVD